MTDMWADHLPPPTGPKHGSLNDVFVVPPFSVLDTKQGYWRERREAWLTLGIQSELGRGDLGEDDDGGHRGHRSSAATVITGGALAGAPVGEDGRMRVRSGLSHGALNVSEGVIEAKDFGGHPAHRMATASPWTRGDDDFVSRAMAGIERGQQTSRRTGDMLVPDGRTLAEAERQRREKPEGYHISRANLPDVDKYRHIETSRRAADLRSNITGAPTLPEYADFGTANVAPGTSIFDPVLCEVIYRWFTPPGGTVLDPFAGGSVRGIVAGVLGHRYSGIDLSERQVEANREQARMILPPAYPRWYVGDSRDLGSHLPAGAMFDLAFSCPPYFDLEVYSDDPRDLSRADSYDDFMQSFGQIIAACAARLHPSRFLVMVVSDVRDKRGMYHGLPTDTVNAARAAGLRLYNEAVLLNPAGTLPMRVARQFEAGRKLGRSHQNVLCFLKGDPPKGWDHQREAPPDPQETLWDDGDLRT